jgi:hypothetical protein
MLKNFIVVITIVFLIIIDGNNCFAKTRPIGFSTASKHLGRGDWNFIKKNIDTIFSFNTLQESLEKNNKANNDISDLVARVSEINWTIEQRKEVSDYLLQTLTRIFVQKGFIDSIKNKKIIIKPGITYQGNCVYEMIYAYGRVCNEIDVENIELIWNKNTDNSDFSIRLRQFLISVLELQIKSEKAIELAKKWQKLISDNDMLQRLNTIIEYHRYAKIESEKVAWELLWERNKPVSGEYFLDTDYCKKIYLVFDKFVNARTKYNSKVWCNSTITFEIANQSDVFEKQYFFISFTIANFFKQCTYSHSDIDVNFIDKLKKSVNRSSEIIKKNGYLKTVSHVDINEIMLQNFLKNFETTIKKTLMTPEPPDNEPSTIPSTKAQPTNTPPPQQPPSNLSESKSGSIFQNYLIALIIIFVTFILVIVIIFRKRKSSPTILISKQ